MKVVKNLFSTLLAIIVIPILVVFIIYLSANAIVSKDGIENIVKRMDMSNFLVDEDGNYNELGNDLRNELIENGLPQEVVDEFINSKQISNFFTEYVGEVADYIINDKDMDKLTSEEISKLINDNIDSIVEELREKKVEGYEELTDERVAEFKTKVDEMSKEIEESLPDIDEAIEESNTKEAIKIVRFVFSGIVFTILFTTIIVFLILILLLNLKNYSFLIWYGAIFIFASLPVILISSLIQTLSKSVDSKAFIDIVNYVFDKVNIYSIGLLLLGIASIVVAIIFRVTDKKNIVE